jgi:hypothetical protein
MAVGISLIAEFHHSVAQMMLLPLVGAAGAGIVVALIPLMIIESVAAEEQALGNGAQSLLPNSRPSRPADRAGTCLARDKAGSAGHLAGTTKGT